MPWCDECSRFYNPNSLPATGICPGCGRALVRPGKLRRLQEGRGHGADALAAASAADLGRTDERATTDDAPAAAPGHDPDEGDHTPIPWHFWLLVVALVIYLGYRFVQLGIWLFH